MRTRNQSGVMRRRSRRTLKLGPRLDVYFCGPKLIVEILECESFIVGRFDDRVNFYSPHTPVQSVKKLEGQLMIPVGHLAVVVPHLVHAKLKARKESLNILRRQLDEVLVFSSISLKQPRLDGVGPFMETLKARPYLVSDVQVTNSCKLGARKTRKQNIHGLVVGIVV